MPEKSSTRFPDRNSKNDKKPNFAGLALKLLGRGLLATSPAANVAKNTPGLGTALKATSPVYGAGNAYIKSGQGVGHLIGRALGHDKKGGTKKHGTSVNFVNQKRSENPNLIPARRTDVQAREHKAADRVMGVKAGATAAERTAAIRAYQEKHGLKVDGIIGEQTLNNMGIRSGKNAGRY